MSNIIDYTAQHKFANELKTWISKDFLVLKTMEAFILACKLAEYVKNRLEVVKTGVFRAFCSTPTPKWGWGVRSEYRVLSLDYVAFEHGGPIFYGKIFLWRF